MITIKQARLKTSAEKGAITYFFLEKPGRIRRLLPELNLEDWTDVVAFSWKAKQDSMLRGCWKYHRSDFQGRVITNQQFLSLLTSICFRQLSERSKGEAHFPPQISRGMYLEIEVSSAVAAFEPLIPLLRKEQWGVLSYLLHHAGQRSSPA